MRILVSGDRNYSDRGIVQAVLDGIHRDWYQRNFPSSMDKEFVVIEGEAPGVDTIARQCAERLDLSVEPYPARWAEHDYEGHSGVTCYHKPDPTRCPAAGPRRNQQMLDEGRPDVVVCFHDNIEASRGTKDMLTRAKDAGIPVYVISRH